MFFLIHMILMEGINESIKKKSKKEEHFLL